MGTAHGRAAARAKERAARSRAAACAKRAARSRAACRAKRAAHNKRARSTLIDVRPNNAATGR